MEEVHFLKKTASSGSNKAQWNAMDLQIRSNAPPTTASASSASSASSTDDFQAKGLSARNILIRRKLMERKRFDSADYAMKQCNKTKEQSETSNPAFSPAQVGVSVFFNALEHDDTSPPTATTTTTPSIPASTTPTRYGDVGNARGNAAAISARNILIQKKLREKKHFDSADYQLAQYNRSSSSSSLSSTEDTSSMEMDTTTSEVPLPMPATSPVPMHTAVRNQMSPSTRNKYEGLSGANVLLMRKLAEKKRFDSADYHMKAPDQQQPPPANTHSPTSSTTSPPPMIPMDLLPAAPGPAPTASPVPAPSKYGKLCAANVLIRKKLKERKRFDSADYSMEHYANQQTTNTTAAPTSQAFSRDHANEDVEMSSSDDSKMNHQVKHIKLTDEETLTRPQANAWTKYGTIATATSNPTPSLPRSLAMENVADSRLAARNIMIQRKLTERKRFDSADYFKDQASANH